MRAALDGVDVVRKRENRLVIFLADVLHGNFDACAILFALHVDDFVVDHRTPGIYGVDVAYDSIVVTIRLALSSGLVRKSDFDAWVEERQLLEALREDVPLEPAVLEYIVVERESDGGSRLLRVPDHLQRRRGVAPDKAHPVYFAVAPHFRLEPFRQSVDARNAHAMQAARNLVSPAAEFAAGVQDGQHNL